MKSKFYKTEYGNQIYSVNSPIWAPLGQSGTAIIQTWVIVGDEYAMAIDSPVPNLEGVRDYLDAEFQRPFMMVNPHGYIDHTGCNEQFGTMRLNKRDWPLLLGGGVKPIKGLFNKKIFLIS